jgi:hypothetical protein
MPPPWGGYEPKTGPGRGFFDEIESHGPRMWLNDVSPAGMGRMEVAQHETKHAIQDLVGWASGGHYGDKGWFQNGLYRTVGWDRRGHLTLHDMKTIAAAQAGEAAHIWERFVLNLRDVLTERQRSLGVSISLEDIEEAYVRTDRHRYFHSAGEAEAYTAAARERIYEDIRHDLGPRAAEEWARKTYPWDPRFSDVRYQDGTVVKGVPYEQQFVRPPDGKGAPYEQQFVKPASKSLATAARVPNWKQTLQVAGVAIPAVATVYDMATLPVRAAQAGEDMRNLMNPPGPAATKEQVRRQKAREIVDRALFEDNAIAAAVNLVGWMGARARDGSPSIALAVNLVRWTGGKASDGWKRLTDQRDQE